LKLLYCWNLFLISSGSVRHKLSLTRSIRIIRIETRRTAETN